MKNQDPQKQLKQLLSDQELPDNLRPEQIKKKLPRNHVHKKSYLPMFAPVVIAVLFLCILPLIQKNQTITPINPTDEKNTSSGISTEVSTEITTDTELAKFTYDDVYEKIHSAYKNSYDDVTAGVGGIVNESAKEELAVDSIMETGTSSKLSEQSDFSQTNIQTKGVDEADSVKTDGTYLYLLNKNQLEIVHADKKKLSKKATITPAQDENQFLEFYLVEQKLVILESAYTDQFENSTQIRVFDIVNPLKPVELSSQNQQGRYETSRLTDGYLYTFSSYQVVTEPVKEKTKTYVPSINQKPIAADCILLPEQNDSTTYLVTTALPLDKPDNFSAEKALLIQSDHYYISHKNIYMTEMIYANVNSDIDRTRITRLPYEKGQFAKPVTGIVAGSILNSFSMDEYDDHLRVVTTVQKYNKTTGSVQSNSLYILDKDMKKTGSITNLAQNERIYSARFMGKTGYFVTFRQVDPLFSVDLSDPQKPRIIGELKIPGFSDYLHFYDENLLLGIGRNADKNGRVEGLKLSMFDISDPANVKEIDKLILKDYDNASALSEHRDVLIHLPRNIFGFAAQAYGKESSDPHMDYLLFTYTKEKGFKTLLKAPITSGWDYNPYSVKGVTIDDYLHIVYPNHTIFTYGLKSYKKLNSFSLEN